MKIKVKTRVSTFNHAFVMNHKKKSYRRFYSSVRTHHLQDFDLKTVGRNMHLVIHWNNNEKGSVMLIFNQSTKVLNRDHFIDYYLL